MKPVCPNLECSFYRSKENVIKDGFFWRKSESRKIQRFFCKSCQIKFSHATGTMEYGQKKRTINSAIKGLLCSGVSLRRCALLQKISRTTVERKLVYLAKVSRLSQEKFRESLKNKITHVQFDDLITIEHTKLKPVTVSVAVDAKNRFIVGAKAARIGAFGHLAVLSIKKYGKRKNEHKKALKELFESFAPTLIDKPNLKSDEHHFYPAFVKKYSPTATYETFKSERSAVAGQGELKKVRHDPLFAINHCLAFFRANVNRLFRKTWCTTKKLEKLQMHLDIFIDYFNCVYLPIVTRK